MRSDEKTVSVVIPAYNEGEQIERLVTETANTLDRTTVSYEIIVVDDGSIDNTDLIAKGSGAHIVLRNESTFGKGYAVRSALDHSSGSIIVVMDADGTYDPRDIPVLIEPVAAGEATLTVGSRLMKPRITHVLGNRVISIISRVLTGSQLTDISSGFRAFRRDDLSKVLKDPSNLERFEEEVELRALSQGFKIVEVPIDWRLRESFGYSRSKMQIPPSGFGFRFFLHTFLLLLRIMFVRSIDKFKKRLT